MKPPPGLTPRDRDLSVAALILLMLMHGHADKQGRKKRKNIRLKNAKNNSNKLMAVAPKTAPASRHTTRAIRPSPE